MEEKEPAEKPDKLVGCKIPAYSYSFLDEKVYDGIIKVHLLEQLSDNNFPCGYDKLTSFLQEYMGLLP